MTWAGMLSGDAGASGASPASLGWPSLDPAAADVAAIRSHLEWLRLRGLSPGTIEARRRALSRMRAALPVPLLKADAAAMAAWRAGLCLAPKTIGTYVSHGYQFYDWARKNGLIPVNPAKDLPVPKRPRRIPRPISEPDLMTALENAPARVRPWLVLAAWSGLRAQEIARLRREDIHERHDPPVLIVSYFAAKGGNERVVPLSPFVVAELARSGLPATGWVFPRADGRPGPNNPARISQAANRYLHACGITATLHQLRHRFGTQLYHRSHDLRLVQDLLGHGDPATTSGYAEWDRADAPAAVNGIPGAQTPC